MTFTSLLTALNALFGSATWTSNNIPTYPENYKGKISNKDEYCRINVLPADSEVSVYGGGKGLQGTLIVDIYVKAGNGQARIMAIADLLDILLQTKNLTNGLELGTSYINNVGEDKANKSLYNAKYLIPFKSYGE